MAPIEPVPEDLENTIVDPPVVRLLSLTSFACKVIVEVVPLAVTLVGDAEIVQCVALIVPGV